MVSTSDSTTVPQIPPNLSEAPIVKRYFPGYTQKKPSLSTLKSSTLPRNLESNLNPVPILSTELKNIEVEPITNTSPLPKKLNLTSTSKKQPFQLYKKQSRKSNTELKEDLAKLILKLENPEEQTGFFNKFINFFKKNTGTKKNNKPILNKLLNNNGNFRNDLFNNTGNIKPTSGLSKELITELNKYNPKTLKELVEDIKPKLSADNIKQSQITELISLLQTPQQNNNKQIIFDLLVDNNKLREDLFNTETGDFKGNSTFDNKTIEYLKQFDKTYLKTLVEQTLEDTNKLKPKIVELYNKDKLLDFLFQKPTTNNKSSYAVFNLFLDKENKFRNDLFDNSGKLKSNSSFDNKTIEYLRGFDKPYLKQLVEKSYAINQDVIIKKEKKIEKNRETLINLLTSPQITNKLFNTNGKLNEGIFDKDGKLNPDISKKFGFSPNTNDIVTKFINSFGEGYIKSIVQDIRPNSNTIISLQQLISKKEFSQNEPKS